MSKKDREEKDYNPNKEEEGNAGGKEQTVYKDPNDFHMNTEQDQPSPVPTPEAQQKQEPQSPYGPETRRQAPESPFTGPVVDKRSAAEVEAEDKAKAKTAEKVPSKAKIDKIFETLHSDIIEATEAGSEQAKALALVFEAKTIIDTVLK